MHEDYHYLNREIAYEKFKNLFRRHERFKTYKGFTLALKDQSIKDLIQTYLEDKEWIENVKINYKDNIKLVESKINHLNDKLKSLSILFKTYSKYEVSKEGFFIKNEYVEIIWTAEEKKNQFLVDFEYILELIKELNDDRYKQKYFATQIKTDFKHHNINDIDFYQFKDNFKDFVSSCIEIYSKIFPKHYNRTYADKITKVGTLMDFWRSIDGYTFFEFSIPSIEFKHDILFFEEEMTEFENKILPLLEDRVRKIERIEHASFNNSFVYVLSNKSYPNIYKIGSTSGTPKDRAVELSSTGVLHPFKVSFQIEIKNAEYYEKLIHKLLREYRVKQSREFFKFDLSKIEDCLKKIYEISEKGEKKLTIFDLKEKIKI